MGRMRTMKPEFFKSRSLAKLPREARWTFVGMWTEADDEGNGIADERLLKGAIWPLDDDLEPLHISAHIRMLAVSGHIELYSVGGETYFHIINFFRHQAAAYRRGEAKFPLVSAGQKVDPELACGGVQESAGRTQMSAVTGNREQGTGNEERNSPAPADENAIILALPATPPATRYPPVFEKAWVAYGRKGAKKDSYGQWQQAIKRASPETILAAIPPYVAATAKEPKFRKDFERWLKGDCWESAVVQSQRPASGGYTAYKDPTDISGYYDPL